MKRINIEDITIGDTCRTLVIPEIGINHGGKLEVAKEMVDAAYRAGARIIKHQTHIVSDEMSSVARNVIPGNSSKSIYEIMSECALSKDDEYELMRYTQSKGMVFLSTPFSRAAADRLEEFGVSAYKIGSGELNNYPLIKHIASFGKPMIVSTGMNNLSKVRIATDIMDAAGINYALLHTTNLYPTKAHQVRLGAMLEMKKEYANIPIGLSDHTINNTACIAAMALGANIVERHFTDRKNRIGPDIVCSMDEYELKDLIQASQDIYEMQGGTKEPLLEEKVTIDFAYATVVSIKPIKSGELFSSENIWVKRPGTGEILAEKYEELFGKRAVCDIANDTQIRWEMVDEQEHC